MHYWGEGKKYPSCCLTVAPLHADLDKGIMTVNYQHHKGHDLLTFRDLPIRVRDASLMSINEGIHL